MDDLPWFSTASPLLLDQELDQGEPGSIVFHDIDMDIVKMEVEDDSSAFCDNCFVVGNGYECFDCFKTFPTESEIHQHNDRFHRNCQQQQVGERQQPDEGQAVTASNAVLQPAETAPLPQPRRRGRPPKKRQQARVEVVESLAAEETPRTSSGLGVPGPCLTSPDACQSNARQRVMSSHDMTWPPEGQRQKTNGLRGRPRKRQAKPDVQEQRTNCNSPGKSGKATVQNRARKPSKRPRQCLNSSWTETLKVVGTEVHQVGAERQEPMTKRRPGRPRKHPANPEIEIPRKGVGEAARAKRFVAKGQETISKRRPGRPRKFPASPETEIPRKGGVEAGTEKNRPGRPRKCPLSLQPKIPPKRDVEGTREKRFMAKRFPGRPRKFLESAKTQKPGKKRLSDQSGTQFSHIGRRRKEKEPHCGRLRKEAKSLAGDNRRGHAKAIGGLDRNTGYSENAHHPADGQQKADQVDTLLATDESGRPGWEKTTASSLGQATLPVNQRDVKAEERTTGYDSTGLGNYIMPKKRGRPRRATPRSPENQVKHLRKQFAPFSHVRQSALARLPPDLTFQTFENMKWQLTHVPLVSMPRLKSLDGRMAETVWSKAKASPEMQNEGQQSEDQPSNAPCGKLLKTRREIGAEPMHEKSSDPAYKVENRVLDCQLTWCSANLPSMERQSHGQFTSAEPQSARVGPPLSQEKEQDVKRSDISLEVGHLMKSDEDLSKVMPKPVGSTPKGVTIDFQGPGGKQSEATKRSVIGSTVLLRRQPKVADSMSPNREGAEVSQPPASVILLASREKEDEASSKSNCTARTLHQVPAQRQSTETIVRSGAPRATSSGDAPSHLPKDLMNLVQTRLIGQSPNGSLFAVQQTSSPDASRSGQSRVFRLSTGTDSESVINKLQHTSVAPSGCSKSQLNVPPVTIHLPSQTTPQRQTSQGVTEIVQEAPCAWQTATNSRSLPAPCLSAQQRVINVMQQATLPAGNLSDHQRLVNTSQCSGQSQQETPHVTMFLRGGRVEPEKHVSLSGPNQRLLQRLQTVPQSTNQQRLLQAASQIPSRLVASDAVQLPQQHLVQASQRMQGSTDEESKKSSLNSVTIQRVLRQPAMVPFCAQEQMVQHEPPRTIQPSPLQQANNQHYNQKHIPMQENVTVIAINSQQKTQPPALSRPQVEVKEVPRSTTENGTTEQVMHVLIQGADRSSVLVRAEEFPNIVRPHFQSRAGQSLLRPRQILKLQQQPPIYVKQPPVIQVQQRPAVHVQQRSAVHVQQRSAIHDQQGSSLHQLQHWPSLQSLKQALQLQQKHPQVEHPAVPLSEFLRTSGRNNKSQDRVRRMVQHERPTFLVMTHPTEERTTVPRESNTGLATLELDLSKSNSNDCQGRLLEQQQGMDDAHENHCNRGPRGEVDSSRERPLNRIAALADGGKAFPKRRQQTGECSVVYDESSKSADQIWPPKEQAGFQAGDSQECLPKTPDGENMRPKIRLRTGLSKSGLPDKLSRVNELIIQKRQVPEPSAVGESTNRGSMLRAENQDTCFSDKSMQTENVRGDFNELAPIGQNSQQPDEKFLVQFETKMSNLQVIYEGILSLVTLDDTKPLKPQEN